jgi:exopolysaccharide production protein ExoQ
LHTLILVSRLMIKIFKSSNTVAHFFSSIALILPIISFIAPKGITPLAIFASLAGLVIFKIQNRKINFLGRPFIILFFLIVFWASITSFWAPNLISAGIGSLKLLGNLLVGVTFFSLLNSVDLLERKSILRSLALGFIIILCLIIVEVLFENPINIFLKDVNTHHLKTEGIFLRGAFWLHSPIVVLSLLIWVLCCYSPYKTQINAGPKKAKYIIIVGFSLVLITASLIAYITSIVAILIGLIGWLAVFVFRRKALISLGVVLAINALALPFLINETENLELKITNNILLPSSAVHRIKIWEFAAKKISERPLLGWGMNSSKHFSDGKNIIYSASGRRLGEALPLHPHNTILQIWVELGLPGILIFLCLSYYFFKITYKSAKPDAVKAIIVGQCLTFFIFASLSFGLWQAWWLCLSWFAVSFMNLAVTSDSYD